jgi:hypothetical protein
MTKSTHVAILLGGFCLLTASSASGQIPSPFGTVRPQNRGPFSTAVYSPPVSPYVNLGVNANGLSNYHTQVRPMIADREMMQRQSAALEQLNQRMRGTAANQAQREPLETTRGAPPRVRFMDYSRYFGTIR